MTDDVKAAQAQELELVAFRVGDQEYCIDIMSVREIRGWTQETALPLSPDFIRGVINLRGSVVPILDLASRLGFDPLDPSQRHVIIITQFADQIVGLLVNGVSDILTIANDQIQPTPDVASSEAREFIQGVIPVEERMISLLAAEKVLPEDLSVGMAA